MARAALEVSALQLVEVLESIQHEVSTPLAVLRVDGGAARNDLLQLQADATGEVVARPRITETNAMDAAFFSSLGCWLLI